MNDTPQQPPTTPSAPSSTPKQDNDKLMAALSYLGILFLIPLLATHNRSAFLSFHLRQGIMLFIVGLIVMLIQHSISWQIGNVLNLVVGIIAIVAIVKVVQGEMWEIPVVGEYAKKIKI